MKIQPARLITRKVVILGRIILELKKLRSLGKQQELRWRLAVKAGVIGSNFALI